MNEDLIFFVSLAVVAVAMLYTGRAAERRVRDYRAKRLPIVEAMRRASREERLAAFDRAEARAARVERNQLAERREKSSSPGILPRKPGGAA